MAFRAAVSVSTVEYKPPTRLLVLSCDPRISTNFETVVPLPPTSIGLLYYRVIFSVEAPFGINEI